MAPEYRPAEPEEVAFFAERPGPPSREGVGAGDGTAVGIAVGVERAYLKHRLRTSLSVVVDGPRQMCLLRWGECEASTEGLRIGAAEIGAIVRGILDDRILLVRVVTTEQELYHLVEERAVASDHLFDTVAGAFIPEQFGRGERVRRANEAVVYSWSGAGDRVLLSREETEGAGPVCVEGRLVSPE